MEPPGAPALHAWAEAGRPLRLVERAVAKDDPDPKALACYGLYLPATNEALAALRGRPPGQRGDHAVPGLVLRPSWRRRGKTALLLVWDNASWHISQEVRALAARRTTARSRRAAAACGSSPACLPVKSPWLNPIEPKWVHGKRRVVEPDRLLTARELAERACDALGCDYEEHLALPQQVA